MLKVASENVKITHEVVRTMYLVQTKPLDPAVNFMHDVWVRFHVHVTQ